MLNQPIATRQPRKAQSPERRRALDRGRFFSKQLAMSSSGAEQPSDYSEFLERCSFPPAGTEVVCAVSGGADSSALLILAVAAGCHAKAVHVDHRLRPGSEEEADAVAGLAIR